MKYIEVLLDLRAMFPVVLRGWILQVPHVENWRSVDMMSKIHTENDSKIAQIWTLNEHHLCYAFSPSITTLLKGQPITTAAFSCQIYLFTLNYKLAILNCKQNEIICKIWK